MANAVIASAATTKVIRIATTQSAVQTYEISRYDQLLETQHAG